MARYLVNTQPQPNGDHEVHHTGCLHLPDPVHRFDLGEHFFCETAVLQAKRVFPTADGCWFCCPNCHTR
jgi:hypothetical protein